jgi:thioredoxin reductase (NADPH)
MRPGVAKRHSSNFRRNPHVGTGNTGTPVELDVAILGAGPAGLSAACACQDHGLSYIIIDRAGLARSFSEYPDALMFFSPPEDMEIGGIPLPTAGGLKPTRETYLAYLRCVARARNLHLATWEEITRVDRLNNGRFELQTSRLPNHSSGRTVKVRAIVLATGVWGEPFTLGVPGCDLPHVFSEFHDPTAFYGQPVLVVGGGNSSVGAALSLSSARAVVSLSMRRPPKNYRSGLRPFVKRDLTFAVEEGNVALFANTLVKEIRPEETILQPVRYTGSEELSEGSLLDYEPDGDPFSIKARFVFALIGHMPEPEFLEETLGLRLNLDGRPECDPRTWETGIDNIFVAGSLASPSIDVVAGLRVQAADVVRNIAKRLK